MADFDHLTRLLTAAAVAGVVSHHLVFRRSEAGDRHPSMVLSLLALLQLGVLALHWPAGWNSSPSTSGWRISGAFAAYAASLAVVGTFVGAIWASMVVYRMWFHPLGAFPGPVAARWSKAWALWTNARSGVRWYAVQQKLREQYGDYVRVGPRELVVFDPAAIPVINSPSSKFTKGPWYDMMEPSLQTFRDKAMHQQRRRIWDRAFSVKSLNEYRPTIESLTDTLVSQLAARVDREVVASDWFDFYGYDVMSAMIFGISADMTQKGERNWVIATIQNTFRAFGILWPIPWIFGIFMTFPGLLTPVVEITKWSRQQVEQRKKMKNPRLDLFHYLLDIDDGSKQSAEWLMADARLAIGAGSDTTSTALTLIFYYLARYPEQLKKLQHAVDEMFASSAEDSCYNTTKGTNCPLLEGVIHEVLRLHPGVPAGVQRVAPPEGATINGRHIPGETIVVMSTYSLCRDERNFTRAHEFIPERWYSQPDLIKNKAAFLPFSSGPYSCVGKGLALMELRSVVARCVREFDVKFVPGFDAEGYLMGVRDHFTTAAPHLKLVFSRRS